MEAPDRPSPRWIIVRIGVIELRLRPCDADLASSKSSTLLHSTSDIVVIDRELFLRDPWPVSFLPDNDCATKFSSPNISSHSSRRLCDFVVINADEDHPIRRASRFRASLSRGYIMLSQSVWKRPEASVLELILLPSPSTWPVSSR